MGFGYMVQKHVAFAPASQKQLGSRLRSPLLQRGTMLAQPFSRFFHHTAFTEQPKRLIRKMEMLTIEKEELILEAFFFIKESHL
jgi:hypothetical protein